MTARRKSWDEHYRRKERFSAYDALVIEYRDIMTDSAGPDRGKLSAPVANRESPSKPVIRAPELK